MRVQAIITMEVYPHLVGEWERGRNSVDGDARTMTKGMGECHGNEDRQHDFAEYVHDDAACGK